MFDEAIGCLDRGGLAEMGVPFPDASGCEMQICWNFKNRRRRIVDKLKSNLLTIGRSKVMNWPIAPHEGSIFLFHLAEGEPGGQCFPRWVGQEFHGGREFGGFATSGE